MRERLAGVHLVLVAIADTIDETYGGTTEVNKEDFKSRSYWKNSHGKDG